MEGKEVRIIGDNHIWTVMTKYTNYLKDYYILWRHDKFMNVITKHCSCDKIREIIL